MRLRQISNLKFIVGVLIVFLLLLSPIAIENQQSVYAAATNGSCGASATWTFDGTNTLTIGGTGKIQDYTYTYYEIGEVFYSGATTPWNQYKDKITNIVISNQITGVGKYAFCGLSKVTSVNFPSSLTEIGEAAFYACSSLTSLTIPDTVTKIDRDAFNQCTGIRSASVPGSIKSLPFMMFSGCKSLETVTIGRGITYIGAAFNECTSLKNVVIPDTVENIDSSAFKKCTSLESIVMPDSVKQLGWYTFDGCTNLKSVTLSKNLISVPYLTFNGCISLTSIDIPDAVKNIGEAAFQGCTSLSTVKLSQNIDWIYSWAFKGCTALKSISFPESTNLVMSEAFMNCSSLDTINFSKRVGFQDSVFKNCTSLKTLTIPKDVGVGSSMFVGCTKLTTVTFEEGFASYITNNMFTGCVSLTAISIPQKSTTINPHAFEGCTNLKEVTIPEGVIQIWDAAFKDCTALTTIKMPDTLGGLGKDVFLGCLSLKQIWFSKFTQTYDTHAVGFDDSYQKIGGVTVYCYDGSAGESYAKTNGLNYQSIKYDISKLKVTLSSTDYFVYNGKEQKPYIVNVQFPSGAVNPILDKDYTIEYSDNINAGTVTVKIKGIGQYTGEISTTYIIKKMAIPGNFTLSEQSFVYDGTQKKPTVSAMLNSSTKLVEGKDYTVEYVDNVAPGTGKVIIKGIGNFDNEATKTFVIQKATLKIVGVENSSLVYDGSPHSIKVDAPEGATVLYGQANGDYKSEKPTFKDVGSYSVYIKVVKENYNDFVGNASITITSKPINDLEVKISPESFVYDGTEKTPKVTIAGLSQGTDYDISFNNTVGPGTGNIMITGRGNYTGNLNKSYVINKGEIIGVKAADVSKPFDGDQISIHVDLPSEATIQYSSDGVSYSYEKPFFTKVGKYKVYYKVIKTNFNDYKGVATIQITGKSITGMKAAFTKVNYMYTGLQIKPSVEIKGLQQGVDYKLSYSNNSNPGTASVLISGIGNYSGEIKKTFTIQLSVPVVKLKSSTGKVLVSWSKVACNGYEIYKANKKGGSYSLAGNEKSNINNTTIKGNKGQTCYIKIKAYVMVNGKKIYGAYSEIKSAKFM